MGANDYDPLTEALERLAAAPADGEAWRSLYLETWPLAVGVAARRLRGNLDLVEDVAQETFLRILRYGSLERLRSAKDFRRYLATVAKHVADTHLRRARSRHETLSPAVPETSRNPEQPSPHDIAASRELAQQISKALKPTERRILRLLLDGCGVDEIATLTGSSYGAAATRLSRIRDKIRNLLPDHGLQSKIAGRP